MVKQAYLGLFLIFLMASTIYVFEPGLPQPADFLMAFLIVVLATGFIVRPAIHKDLVFFAALFVGYVALVNLFWYTQYQTGRFWLSALYYAYNFGAMMVVLSLIRAFGTRFVHVAQLAIAVTIVIEAIAVLVLPSGFRAYGTFNNANQLGYSAILLSCCYLVLKDQRLGPLDFAVLCGAGYLTAASLSKAAMLSFVLLLLMGLISEGVTRTFKLLLLALAFIGTSTVLLDSGIDRFMSIGVAERVEQRFTNLGSDSTVQARGYDRIWRYPEHLIFGAGEGEAQRFAKFSGAVREMHSTLGTVLFSYGIVGFALFFGFLVMVFRRAPLPHVLYSLPIWAYGMTHQGLRDTMLWVFFGMVFGMAHYVRAPKQQRTVVAPELCAPANAPVIGHGRVSGTRSARR